MGSMDEMIQLVVVAGAMQSANKSLNFYLHSVVKQHSRLYKMAINCGFSKNGPDFTQMFDMLLIEALQTCFCKFEMCPNNKTCIQEERVSPSFLKKNPYFLNCFIIALLQ